MKNDSNDWVLVLALVVCLGLMLVALLHPILQVFALIKYVFGL